MTIITRLEVIDENGRSYVNWEDDNDVSWQFQDGGKTLKIFVNTVKPKTGEEGALKLLEYQETVRTDVEKAYRDFYGHYPIIDMSTNDYDAATWVAFKEGYKAGQK